MVKHDGNFMPAFATLVFLYVRSIRSKKLFWPFSHLPARLPQSLRTDAPSLREKEPVEENHRLGKVQSRINFILKGLAKGLLFVQSYETIGYESSSIP
jgi:hypothetical protein